MQIWCWIYLSVCSYKFKMSPTWKFLFHLNVNQKVTCDSFTRTWESWGDSKLSNLWSGGVELSIECDENHIEPTQSPPTQFTFSTLDIWCWRVRKSWNGYDDLKFKLIQTKRWEFLCYFHPRFFLTSWPHIGASGSPWGSRIIA